MADKLVSLKLPKSDADKGAVPKSPSDLSDGYPYGSRFSVSGPAVKKLDIGRFKAGDVVMVEARCKIKEISSRDADGSKSESGDRVEFQMMDVCVESDDEERAEHDDTDEDVFNRVSEESETRGPHAKRS